MIMKNMTRKTIFLLMAVLTVIFTLQSSSNANAACSTSADCPSPYFYGGQFCKNNSLYQTRITYSCVNSACVSRQEPYFIQTCSGTDNICVEGLWYTGCKYDSATTGTNNTTSTTTTPQGQCYSHSYQKCVANNVYWFDSCNIQQDLSKACGADEICQSGSCIKNYTLYPTTTYYPSTGVTVTETPTPYTSHFSKGCQNNIVYWYDTLGNKNDIYQNCNYSGQLCQDGKCVADPTPKPAPAPAPAPVPAKINTPAKTVSTLTCDSGKVLAQACVPLETFNSNSSNESSADTPDNTQVVNETSNQNTQVTSKQNNNTAALSEIKTNPIMEFFNKWYIWIIAGILITIFFIIIFRKSSLKIEGKIQKK